MGTSFYLILDAVAGYFDVAIVLSNDRDLADPIRRVWQRFGVAIDVLNPTDKTSNLLRSVASSYKAATLADARLPVPEAADSRHQDD